MSSLKNGERPPSRFAYLLQLLPERMRPKKPVNAQNLLPFLLETTEAKNKAKIKRRVAIAILLGGLSGIICDTLPPQYQVGCAIVIKIWKLIAALLVT